MTTENAPTATHHFRFHFSHNHLHSVFGDDWFARKAEAFARFFGTPIFLISQTAICALWIIANMIGWTSFNVYPFILLNLAFSVQAAYAAPLILLAQTRQADRDKAHADADAQHREDLARLGQQQQDEAVALSKQLMTLIEQNNALTERVEMLTREVHARIVV